MLLHGKKHCPLPILPILEPRGGPVRWLRLRPCYSKGESTARCPSCSHWNRSTVQFKGFGGGCASPREKALPAAHPAHTGTARRSSRRSSAAAVLLQRSHSPLPILPTLDQAIQSWGLRTFTSCTSFTSTSQSSAEARNQDSSLPLRTSTAHPQLKL